MCGRWFQLFSLLTEKWPVFAKNAPFWGSKQPLFVADVADHSPSPATSGPFSEQMGCIPARNSDVSTLMIATLSPFPPPFAAPTNGFWHRCSHAVGTTVSCAWNNCSDTMELLFHAPFFVCYVMTTRISTSLPMTSWQPKFVCMEVLLFNSPPPGS